MSDADDKDRMERLREGDDLALNELMTRWKQPLVTFCIRFTGNTSDAHDIAQETFVKVYQSRKRYKPRDALFSTWLFSIATNLCRMRHRWKSRHPELLDSDREQCGVFEDLDAEQNGPREAFDMRVLVRDLESAILGLPPKLRGAFILREIHGISTSEIASIQGCTSKAVERRLARAREKLRALLKDQWA